MVLRFQYYLIVLLSPLLLTGQQISHLGPFEGIGNGAVRAFAKDSMGYMDWYINGTTMDPPSNHIKPDKMKEY